MSDSSAKNADLSALKINRDRTSRAPGRWKRWLHLLWLLVPVVAYFVYQQAIHEVTPAVKVRTAVAGYLSGSEASAELVATGYVVAQVKAAVASKATGRLRVLNVEEGDSVREGDVLAELENDDIQAEVQLARAYLKQARADSVQAALNYRRQKRLLESGHTTEEVLETSTAAFQRAIAGVEAQQAVVRSAEVALENTIIRAPFDGTVLTKHADIGEMVAPFASASSSRGAVVTMANMRSLEVEADVSESNINKVVIGRSCEIVLDAYPRFKYTGYVKKIVPTADRSRATVLTKVAFNDIDARVLPEMSARVNFLSEPDATEQAEVTPTLVVSKNAVTMREGEHVVFMIADGLAKSTPVEIGRQFGDVTEIVSGLADGDVVILSPPGGLNSGDKVEQSR